MTSTQFLKSPFYPPSALETPPGLGSERGLSVLRDTGANRGEEERVGRRSDEERREYDTAVASEIPQRPQRDHREITERCWPRLRS